MSDKPAHTFSLETGSTPLPDLSLAPMAGQGANGASDEAAVASFLWPSPPFPMYAAISAEHELEDC